MERRQAIRETWGAFKVHQGFRLDVAFILGLSANKNINDQIKRESDTFGDILLLNQVDSAG